MLKRLNNSRHTAKVVRIDPSNPDPEAIGAAVKILKNKGVLVFPTSGLYGLGVDACCAEAVRQVFAIKRRPPHKPLLALLAGSDALIQLVRAIPAYAEPLLGLWPGGVTLIFEAHRGLPRELTGGTDKIGVRIPAHPVAKALLDQFGAPITGTSANVSGSPATDRVSDLDPALRRQVDMIVDTGTLSGGPGSTIVDATCWPVRIIREGCVSRQAIDEALKNG